MAFPARLDVVDTFDRADGAPGADYSAVTGYSSSVAISGNRLVASADDALILYTRSGPFRNGWLALTRAALSSGTAILLAFRASADGRAGYVWQIAGTYTNVFALNDVGSRSSIGGSRTTTAWAAGDLPLVRFDGSTIELWRQRSGVPELLHTITDSTYGDAGYVGIGGDSSGSNQLDDLVVASSDSSAPSALSRWCGIPTDDAVEAVTTVSGGTRGRLVVSTRSDLSSPVLGAEETISTERVLRSAASGLDADTGYYYGWQIDGDLVEGGRGQFTTAPSTADSFSFAFASCWHRDAFETPVWDRIARAAPAFMLEIGDFGYPDDFGTFGNTVADLRTNYDEIGTRSYVAAAMETVPVGYVWDDHDSGGDDAWSGSTAMPNAQQVYRERVPFGPDALPDEDGVYRTFVWGRCRFIILDCRSFRDQEEDTDDASKTMLGAGQIAWLEGVLRAASEPVIFVISSVSWNDPRKSWDDAWGRYTTEQASLVSSWRSLGVLDRLVMLSGDAHMLAADDGTNSPGGIPALQAAPIAATGSRKGGTFSEGSVVGDEQYALVTITDAGGDTIRVDYAGVTDDGSTAVTLALTIDTTAPSSPLMIHDGSTATPAELFVHDGSGPVAVSLEVL